jgi:Arc/MetJ-type ribon-helix-helix transcriptional regulator
MKQSISVTIDRALVGWIDGEVKTQKYRNRSHLVEVAILRMKENEKKE